MWQGTVIGRRTIKLGDDFSALDTEFFEQINKMKKDGNEHGFIVCIDSDEKWVLREGKGLEDSFALPNCAKDEVFAGWFHTHPHRNQADPSGDDLYHTVELGGIFLCIGTKKQIRCFQPEDVTKKDIKLFLDTDKDDHIIKKTVISYEKNI